MKQLFKKEDLIGKTIKYFVFGKEDLWISFTDDSFVQIIKEECGQGFESDSNMNVNDYTQDNTHIELVYLGLITKKQYDLAVKKQEEEFEKYRRESELRREKEIEEREKKLLNDLKNKYESH